MVRVAERGSTVLKPRLATAATSSHTDGDGAASRCLVVPGGSGLFAVSFAAVLDLVEADGPGPDAALDDLLPAGSLDAGRDFRGDAELPVREDVGRESPPAVGMLHLVSLDCLFSQVRPHRPLLPCSS